VLLASYFVYILCTCGESVAFWVTCHDKWLPNTEKRKLA